MPRRCISRQCRAERRKEPATDAFVLSERGPATNDRATAFAAACRGYTGPSGVGICGGPRGASKRDAPVPRVACRATSSAIPHRLNAIELADNLPGRAGVECRRGPRVVLEEFIPDNSCHRPRLPPVVRQPQARNSGGRGRADSLARHRNTPTGRSETPSVSSVGEDHRLYLIVRNKNEFSRAAMRTRQAGGCGAGKSWAAPSGCGLL